MAAWRQCVKFLPGAQARATALGHSERKAIRRTAGKHFAAIPGRDELCNASTQNEEFWPFLHDSSAVKHTASHRVTAIAKEALSPRSRDKL
jgi:hypothetical protein